MNPPAASGRQPPSIYTRAQVLEGARKLLGLGLDRFALALVLRGELVGSSRRRRVRDRKGHITHSGAPGVGKARYQEPSLKPSGLGERSARLVAQAGQELGVAIDELREVAHGIYPSVLADEGVAAT